MTRIKPFYAKVGTLNGFALNRYKSVQIYFFCVKHKAKKKKKKKKKNDFLKNVENRVGVLVVVPPYTSWPSCSKRR